VSAEELKETFTDWWKDSFPNVPPNSRTVETHVAFAAYVLELKETLAEYGLDS
jgi:hypothetical protein